MHTAQAQQPIAQAACDSGAAKGHRFVKRRCTCFASATCTPLRPSSQLRRPPAALGVAAGGCAAPGPACAE